MLTEQLERSGEGEDPGYDPLDDPPIADNVVNSKELLLENLERYHDNPVLFKYFKKQYDRRYGKLNE